MDSGPHVVPGRDPDFQGRYHVLRNIPTKLDVEMDCLREGFILLGGGARCHHQAQGPLNAET